MPAGEEAMEGLSAANALWKVVPICDYRRRPADVLAGDATQLQPWIPMSDLQLAVLALVQGITEFLPISSSGHLILVPLLTGWPDQGLLLDVAVHVGSLFAVMLYFWRDLATMLLGLISWRGGGLLDEPGRRLLALVAVGTVPVVLAGLALKLVGTEHLRSAAVIGWTTLVFGLLLYVADRLGAQERSVQQMGFGGALAIGLAQILALVPGTSRSGITMTAARGLGFRRDEAARFSMLLSIPTIIAAGALLTLDLIELGQTDLRSDVLLAALLAFASAWLAIALLMRWLQRASFTPFVVYRVILGVALLAYAYA
jgi:undecaprenyl-diphosphatase